MVEETVQIEEAPCDESVPEVADMSEDQPDHKEETTTVEEAIKTPPPDSVRSPSEGPSVSSEVSSDYSDLESYEARRAARRLKREMKMKEKVHPKI